MSFAATVVRADLPNSVEVGAYRRALLRDPCAYCGRSSCEFEHIEPRATGGVNDWTNLTGACLPCNRAKGTLSLLGYLGARGWFEVGRP